MAEDEISLCHAVMEIASKLEVIVTALNEVGADVELAGALARDVLVHEIGEPIVEGVDAFDAYKMVFKCHENGAENYVVVEVFSTADCGIMLNHMLLYEFPAGMIEKLKPERIELKIEHIKDEKTERLINEIKSGSGG